MKRITDLMGVDNRRISAFLWDSGVSDGSTLVCAFPGYSYPLEAPLLFYLKLSCLKRGYDWLGFDYRYNENDPFLALSEGEQDRYFDREQEIIGRYIRENYPERKLIFLGKSLGTSAISRVLEGGEFAGADKKVILLTPTDNCFSLAPVLEKEETPALSLIGDRDPFYERYINSPLYRSKWVTTHILEGADHILVDGERGLEKSLGNLYDTVERIDGFLA